MLPVHLIEVLWYPMLCGIGDIVQGVIGSSRFHICLARFARRRFLRSPFFFRRRFHVGIYSANGDADGFAFCVLIDGDEQILGSWVSPYLMSG